VRVVVGPREVWFSAHTRVNLRRAGGTELVASVQRLFVARRIGYALAMIRKASRRGYQLALPGIERKTLAFGEHTLMTEFRMRKGSTLPAHAHPQEQTGYLVSGRVRLTIGRRNVDVRPGDSWSIPGGTKHGAAILKNSVAIEVFSPVREDYLPRAQRIKKTPAITPARAKDLRRR